MLLPWLILIPFIGGLICYQCERFGSKIPHWIALFTLLIVLILLFTIWQKGSYPVSIAQLPQWNSEFLFPWIPYLGISIHLALDGLSLLMIALTLMLSTLAILCSWTEIKNHQGFFNFNLLLLLGSIIGVFLAIDLFLFFLFWEIILIPMYFLIVLWGHRTPKSKANIIAVNKFIIYTQISGLMLLVVILSLVLIHYKTTSILTFNYEELLYTSMPKQIEYLLMLCLFLAFAIKMPIVPLHGWLPDVHNYTPTTGSVDLVGIIPKIAAYGILRFSLPLFPYASHQFSPIAMWLGIICIVYGAWIAFSQTNIKRFIAYTSISNIGFTLIAIYSNCKLAYQGAIIQMIAHGLSTSGMFIICGQLYKRLYTYDMRQMGGLWSNKQSSIPAFALFFAVSMLALPGTGNFAGEIIILIGIFQIEPLIAMISMFSLLLASVYTLIMMQHTYFGLTSSLTKPLSDIVFRERLVIFVLVFSILILGLFPQFIINISSIAIDNIKHSL